MNPPTLTGPLYHRYKPRKWTRLSHCILTPGAHLQGFKSSHALSPSVSVFISAATSAVYAGRDSGMEYVIKVTHPAPQKATVFAADSETEALAWINVSFWLIFPMIKYLELFWVSHHHSSRHM